jgi:hypothetical protein
MLRYKQLRTVEQTFRTAKHLLATRPTFHKLDETCSRPNGKPALLRSARRDPGPPRPGRAHATLTFLDQVLEEMPLPIQRLETDRGTADKTPL